ncbi:hypothetical protein GCM10017668_64880 [Streptomyces tuirus]|uniref:Uncharacterized protein n=1 Tax=Streptomyces tuirus TaxID=68278 RepID=A0A7G1NU99_9ACTN|nr:hypothetical protein GCM10017668_64880 [Streptomyces tuirus]
MFDGPAVLARAVRPCPAAGDLRLQRDRAAGFVMEPAVRQPAGGEPGLQDRQNGRAPSTARTGA